MIGTSQTIETQATDIVLQANKIMQPIVSVRQRNRQSVHKDSGLELMDTSEVSKNSSGQKLKPARNRNSVTNSDKMPIGSRDPIKLQNKYGELDGLDTNDVQKPPAKSVRVPINPP